MVTGALHEDGWSDMVDGFGGGWDREKVLAIMRDSCIGSFGSVALTMMLLVRFFASGQSPAWYFFLESVVAVCLWPVASWLLLAPQRRAVDRDHTRPI